MAKFYKISRVVICVFLPAVCFFQSYAGDSDTTGVVSEMSSLSVGLTGKEYFSVNEETTNNANETTSGTKKKKKKWFEGIRYSGNARFFGFYRNLDEYYNTPTGQTGVLTLPKNVSIGDGTVQPLLLLAFEGNPTANSRFKFEFNFDHLLLRTANLTDEDGRIANLFVLFNFEGGIDTRLGNFKLISGGGVNWYRLSPSTFWGYQYRDDLFVRYPFEPDINDFERYNSFYVLDDVARDARWGKQGTQGFILESTGMPYGFDAAIIYGKNTQTGGFQSFIVRDPQTMFATRIGKSIKKHKVGFNYFNESGSVDNTIEYDDFIQGEDTFFVDNSFTSQVIATVDARMKFKQFEIYSEIGAGSYLSNTFNRGLTNASRPGTGNISRYKREWDETVFLEVSTKKSLTGVPITLNTYRIGAKVVNVTSNVFNTSIEQAKPSPRVPDENFIDYYDGLITSINQFANNRQGANITTFFHIGKLKSKIGLGMAQELENLAGDLRNGARANVVAGSGADSNTVVPFTNSITYHQRLVGVSRARFNFFRRFTGPYNRIMTSFRRTFENVAITDSIINYKKSFSDLEFELKHKIKVFNKELILISFTNYSSVQEKWSPIPKFNDKAFIRYFYQELLGFYGIHPKVTLVSYLGLEKVRGNKRTELADADGNLVTNTDGRPIVSPDGKPIDQNGFAYGIGLDYNFDNSASLHLRSRWYDYHDNNFTQDRFKGHEVSLEFKKFF